LQLSDTAEDRPGRAVGIDLGTRRIGIAVTDSDQTVALPRCTIHRTADREADRRKLVDLAVEEEAVVVVVGLPLSLDGSRGPAAIGAVEEADALRSMFEERGIELELFDERLTTVTAHQSLAQAGTSERGRREIVDQAAAAVMLTGWLEARRSGPRR
jgi:putative holliday junction resolvase